LRSNRRGRGTIKPATSPEIYRFDDAAAELILCNGSQDETPPDSSWFGSFSTSFFC